MSQVDLLLPQTTLSACEPRKSSDRDSYVDKNGEPPGDELGNENDKQGDDIVATVMEEFKHGSEEHDHQPQVRRKRHRRGKKRKYRPYCKLTWDERRVLQDREAKRAERVRADMCACGMTLAPYNTTQFLMEDHNLKEPDYEHIPVGQHRQRMNSNSNDSSDDYYSSPEDEVDFLQQQFTETYKSIHAERLSNMSKGELVQELMSTEDRLEILQKSVEDAKAKAERMSRTDPPKNLEEQLEKIRVFKEEIFKLSQENDKLRRENEDLRRQIHL